MKQQTKFKETKIEKTSEDWEISTIADALDINPKRELKKGTNAKAVAMQDIKEFNKKIKNFTLKPFKGGSKFKKGDTLMARITPCLENGKTAFVDILEDKETGFGSTEFIVLSGKDGKTINEFVYYLAISPQMRADAIQSMTGTSGRQRVQNDLLGSKEITLPTINEQKSIAKILSDLDAKIELNQQMNKILEAIGQALFKRWFIDFEFLNEKGEPYKSSGGKMIDSELGEIPKGWEVGSIYDISEVVYGAPFSSNLFNKDGIGLPLIRIRDLMNSNPTFYTNEKHPKGTIINSGDIIAGMDAEFRPYIWLGEKSYLNQRLCLFKPKTQFHKYFVLKTIQPLLNFFENSKVGTTVIHLGKSDIDTWRVIIPAGRVNNMFSKIIEGIFCQIVNNSKEIKNLSQIRDSLLPQLMSGKIRVGKS